MSASLLRRKRRPGKDDPSRPRRGSGYADKKLFYQSEDVARDYDFHRWGSPERARRNLREWATIQRALALTQDVRSILDMPCGTGRFTGALAKCGYDVVGADISSEMMQVARERLGPLSRLHGYVRAEAESLPFASDTFDCVMSIRFLFHVDARTRAVMLRDMARVSRRWLILDYRHKYAYRYVAWRIRRALGLTKTPLERISRSGLEAELSGAGIRTVAVLPVARVFSDKWIVVGEKSIPSAS